jgi:hypothetical protein
MAITLDHTEANALSFAADAVPDKGEYVWAPIDAGAGAYYDYVNVQLSVGGENTIDGAGADVLARFSADSGTVDSTANITLFNITAVAIDGLTKIYTFQLSRFNFVEIGVFNNTTSAAVVTVSGKWEGVKVSDA